MVRWKTTHLFTEPASSLSPLKISYTSKRFAVFEKTYFTFFVLQKRDFYVFMPVRTRYAVLLYAQRNETETKVSKMF